MKIIASQPNLVSQVHQALVAEIAQGSLRPGARIIQEQIADELGVSRQPVQQALLLLRNQGVLCDAPGRGLIVAPLDPEHVRHMYDIRAVVEGLAFRKAAQFNAENSRKLGPALIRNGRSAATSGSVTEMIAADLRFHSLIHDLSRNPLIAPMMDAQWTCTQRVMGEALMGDDGARDIWTQHEAMLEAVCAGDADRAEALARQHIHQAAEVVIRRLRTDAQGHAPPASAMGRGFGREPAPLPGGRAAVSQFKAF